MPFVKRDSAGRIEAVSQARQAGFEEELEAQDAELHEFLRTLDDNVLAETDLSFVRVLEDVIELLIDRNVIRFTDLPLPAQQKMLARQQLRDQLRPSLELIDDDPLI